MTRSLPLATVLLAACTPTMADVAPDGIPTAIEAESIRYATMACYGTCPVYSVDVRPDGSATFTGEANTAVAGTRTFAVSRDEARRFAERLRPYRPATGDLRYVPGENCEHYATDMPSTSVTWNSNTGAAPQTLTLYAGCAREAPAGMADALRQAPDLLPALGTLVGRR